MTLRERVGTWLIELGGRLAGFDVEREADAPPVTWQPDKAPCAEDGAWIETGAMLIIAADARKVKR